MSRKESSPTDLSDASPASQSPKATVTEADDKIRVKVDNLISKSVQFIGELLADVLGFYKGGVSGDAFGFGSAEPFKIVSRRMELEYIGTNNLRMQSPYSLDTTRVRLGVVFVEVITISEGEGNDAGFIEHPQEFGAGWADEGRVHSGFDFAAGFANQ